MATKSNNALAKMINNIHEDVKCSRELMHNSKVKSEDTAELIWLLREDNRLLNESLLELQQELKKSSVKQNEDIIKVRIEEDESRMLVEAEMERALEHCRHTEDLKNKLEIRNHVLEGHFKEQEAKSRQFESKRKDLDIAMDDLKSENFALTTKLLNCEEFCATLEKGHDENQLICQKIQSESKQTSEKLTQENNEMQIAIIEWAAKCSMLESENASLRASARLASAAGFGQAAGNPFPSDLSISASVSQLNPPYPPKSDLHTSYMDAPNPKQSDAGLPYPKPSKSVDFSDSGVNLDYKSWKRPASQDMASLPTAHFEKDGIRASDCKSYTSLAQHSRMKNSSPLMYYQDQNPHKFAQSSGGPRVSTSPAKSRSPMRECEGVLEDNVSLLGPKKLSDITRFLNR